MESNYIQKQIKRTNRNLFIGTLFYILPTVFFTYGAIDGFTKDSYQRQKDGVYFLAVLAGLFIFLTLWNVIKLLRRGLDYKNHPLYKKLALYGDPDDLAFRIENEMVNATTFKPIVLTKSWFIHPKTFSVNLFRLWDVVWCYGVVTSHSTNGIPTGKSYKVMVFFANGSKTEVPASKQAYQDMVAFICDNAPWAYRGYSEQIEDFWMRNRKEFLEEVNKERPR